MSCTICGHFVLYNGTATSAHEYEDQAFVYDTVMMTPSGAHGRAKLIISLTNAHLYADATMICVIARGGPMYPFGYLLYTTCILTLIPNTPLYRDVYNHCRVSTLCKVLDIITVYEYDHAHLTVETVTSIFGCEWYWTMRYVKS